MADSLTMQRRAVEAALVRVLTRAGIGCGDLAPLVAECAESERDWAQYRGEPADEPAEIAGEIAICELDVQVRYVLDQCGLEEGERRLMNLVWAASRAA